MLLSKLNFFNSDLNNYPKIAISFLRILYDISVETNYEIIVLFLDGVIILIPISKNSRPRFLPLVGSRRLATNIGEVILKTIEESDLPSLLTTVNMKEFDEKVKKLKVELNHLIKMYLNNRENK
jgi:CO dehydrogenase/acetyl-CoA synthase epsilon subunit